MDMSLFCLLWTPFFYLFWRSITGSRSLVAGVIAVFFGSLAALFQFFFGFILDSGEFGFYRWLSGCVDVVVLPALLPILFYLIIIGFNIVSGPANFANFAQLWLIPGAIIRALTWSSQNDPIILVLVPILWTAISLGIPFFINLLASSKKPVIIFSSFGIVMVPFAAATSYWAFFSHKSGIGFLFLLAAVIPALISVVMDFSRTE